MPFLSDNGKSAPSSGVLELDFEHDELTGRKSDSPHPGEDGDFSGIRGDFVPAVKGYRGPHSRNIGTIHLLTGSKKEGHFLATRQASVKKGSIECFACRWAGLGCSFALPLRLPFF